MFCEKRIKAAYDTWYILQFDVWWMKFKKRMIWEMKLKTLPFSETCLFNVRFKIYTQLLGILVN